MSGASGPWIIPATFIVLLLALIGLGKLIGRLRKRN